jgi:hypothetical protein
MQRRFNLLLPLAIGIGFAASLTLGSCAFDLTDLDEPDTQVPIRVTAFAVGTPVSTLVIEVTAEDIKGRLAFNLEVIDGVASGTIDVPSGEARTFTVTAYDDHHNVTHTGSKTTDVNPGSNPPLKVKLKPVAGEVDIEVTFGDYGVVVTPSAVEFTALGETVDLVATVFDQYDEEVPGAEVQWATTHPTIASVSSAGLVTALADGAATIVATYAGVAGICEVTVVDGNPPVQELLQTTYSATWEMEWSTVPVCAGQTEFATLLSSTGSFVVGSDDTDCDAYLRGVLEFDLSTVTPGQIHAQLALTQTEDQSGSFAAELHGFNGNGTVDQADANVDNVLMQFSTSAELNEPVTLDVTSFVQQLLDAGARYAGFTIAHQSIESRWVSFNGLGDLYPPTLTVRTAVP